MSTPKVRFCRHGHDTDICGRDSRNWCQDCRRAAEKRRAASKPQRYCVNRHDTRHWGRRANGRCVKCESLSRIGRLHDADRCERLPIAPLLAVFEGRGLPLRSLGLSLCRQMSRFQNQGYIPVMSADKIACEVLGLHPFDIWGPDFIDPPAWFCMGALLAARDRAIQAVVIEEAA